MILGFLLTALYVPGIAGAATTPRWALLAVALPISLLWNSSSAFAKVLTRWPAMSGSAYAVSTEIGFAPEKRKLAAYPFTLAHLFGALFLTWSATSLIWTPNRLDGIGELIKLVILVQVFVFGRQSK